MYLYALVLIDFTFKLSIMSNQDKEEKTMSNMDTLDLLDKEDANKDLANFGIEISQQLNGLQLSESATRGLGVLLSRISSEKE